MESQRKLLIVKPFKPAGCDRRKALTPWNILKRRRPSFHFPVTIMVRTGNYGMMAIDSTHVKAHRSAAGAKGGPSDTPSAAHAVCAQRKPMRRRTTIAGLSRS